ncbi:MAG: VirB6/TrbL-like conjugal transfer protein, CD1112 family [Lachnospiraceae bacterium]
MNICMAVFDVAQHVIAQSVGLINGSTAINASTLAAMQTTLESKGVGELIGIFYTSIIYFSAS